jgi:hypothetical protein
MIKVWTSAVTKMRVYHTGLINETSAPPACMMVRPSIMYMDAAKKRGPIKRSTPWVMKAPQASLSK